MILLVSFIFLGLIIYYFCREQSEKKESKELPIFEEKITQEEEIRNLYYGKDGFYRKKGKKRTENRIDLFNMNLLLSPPELKVLNPASNSSILSNNNTKSINYSADSKNSYELISDNQLDRSHHNDSI